MVYIVLIILFAMLALGIYVLVVGIFVKKKKPDVMEYYTTVKTADDLRRFFRSRDSLIELLTSMSKHERFLSWKNLGMEKPSELLMSLYETEGHDIEDAILRMYIRLNDEIKASHRKVSYIIEDEVTEYSGRLYKKNQIYADRCIGLLKQYEEVVGTIAEADNMDGHDFEYWCADVLRKNGYSNVEVTKGSGDQGVDILAEKDGIRYAVQCKCYSRDLDNTPVQEVNAGKAIYGCQIGAVMTNRHFTKSAKELAAATGTLLWDRDALGEMIKCVS